MRSTKLMLFGEIAYALGGSSRIHSDIEKLHSKKENMKIENISNLFGERFNEYV